MKFDASWPASCRTGKIPPSTPKLQHSTTANCPTDHRINLTIQNLPAVLEGDLAPLIEALMADDYQKRLAMVG